MIIVNPEQIANNVDGRVRALFKGHIAVFDRIHYVPATIGYVCQPPAVSQLVSMNDN